MFKASLSSPCLWKNVKDQINVCAKGLQIGLLPTQTKSLHPFLQNQIRHKNSSPASIPTSRPLKNTKGIRSSKYSFDIKRTMDRENEWIVLGDQQIHAWSLSGVESCIVAKIGRHKFAFDMGYATAPSISCQEVFISHGHIDHVAAVMKHAAHRSLFSLKPATYYIPSHLKDPLQKLAEAQGALHGVEEDFSKINIHPLDHGDSIALPGGITVVPFPTCHRVPSQGYIVYQTKKKLKPHLVGLPSQEIGLLVKEGQEIHDIITTPEFAYTGDTMFDVFKSPPNEDLLKVRTLVTEATYIDDEKDKQGRGGVERARMRGHIHLQEINDNEDIFKDVQNLVLVHFSGKYSTRYIQKKFDELVSDSLKEKVTLGTLMKDTLG